MIQATPLKQQTIEATHVVQQRPDVLQLDIDCHVATFWYQTALNRGQSELATLYQRDLETCLKNYISVAMKPWQFKSQTSFLDEISGNVRSFYKCSLGLYPDYFYHTYGYELEASHD